MTGKRTLQQAASSSFFLPVKNKAANNPVSCFIKITEDLFISADYMGRFRTQDVYGNLLQEFAPIEQNRVMDMALLQNKSNLQLVAVYDNGAIRIWNPEEGTLVKEEVGNNSGIRCVTVAKDTIITGSNDGKIQIWNTQNSTSRILAEHTNSVNCIKTWGDYIVSSSDKTLYIWDLNGICIAQLQHQHVITCIDISVMQHIITGAADGTLHIWRQQDNNFTDKRIEVFTKNNHECAITNPQSQNEINNVVTETLDGDEEEYDALLADSDDDNDSDEEVNPLEIPNANREEKVKDKITCIATHANKIISGHLSGALHIWNAKTHEHIDTLNSHDSWIIGLAITKDKGIISIARDCTLHLWPNEAEVHNQTRPRAKSF
jgi:WD40 repeat protein